MRPYPTDSPQAAARIVALGLIADGRLHAAEMRSLTRSQAARRLGLAADDLHGIVHALCDDLVADAGVRGDDRCLLDPETLARLFAEVESAALRRKVMRLLMMAIRADGRLHEDEMRVLLAAIDHWSMCPEGLDELMPPPPMPACEAAPRGRPPHPDALACAP